MKAQTRQFKFGTRGLKGVLALCLMALLVASANESRAQAKSNSVSGPVVDLTKKNLYFGLNYVLGTVPGVTVDTEKNELLLANPKSWSITNPDDHQTTVAHKSWGISVDQRRYYLTGKDKTQDEFITFNRDLNEATITTVVDKKITSHTVVSGEGTMYSATPEFCEAMKTASKSDNYHDMAQRANMCVSFAQVTAKTDDPARKKVLDSYLHTTVNNANKLKGSGGSSLAPATPTGADQIPPVKNDAYALAERILMKGTPPSAVARPIKRADGTWEKNEDVIRMMVTARVAELCRQLFDKPVNRTLKASPVVGNDGKPIDASATAK